MVVKHLAPCCKSPWHLQLQLTSETSTILKWHRGVVIVITSLKWAWIRVLLRFKPCSWRVGNSRWWGSLRMVAAGNKAKRLSSDNPTTKTIHHHHHSSSQLNTMWSVRTNVGYTNGTLEWFGALCKTQLLKEVFSQ